MTVKSGYLPGVRMQALNFVVPFWGSEKRRLLSDTPLIHLFSVCSLNFQPLIMSISSRFKKLITMRSRSKAWGLMQNHEIMRTDFKIPLLMKCAC